MQLDRLFFTKIGCYSVDLCYNSYNLFPLVVQLSLFLIFEWQPAHKSVCVLPLCGTFFIDRTDFFMLCLKGEKL